MTGRCLGSVMLLAAVLLLWGCAVGQSSQPQRPPDRQGRDAGGAGVMREATHTSTAPPLSVGKSAWATVSVATLVEVTGAAAAS